MIIALEEAKYKLTAWQETIDELGSAIRADELKNEIDEMEKQTFAEDFWNDQENSSKVLQKIKQLKDKYEAYIGLKTKLEDTLMLAEMAIEENDEGSVEEVQSELEFIEREAEQQRLATLLNGEYDKNNAIVSFHPGAGGTEAQDWALMLYRMYTRWGERHGYQVKLVDWLDGEEAGLKSATIMISGLEITAHRSSGAGGQHINKTDSAIRIVHIPTGIVVGCQTERSQLQNKETALKMLKSKLLEIKEREKLDKIEDIQGNKTNIEWGAQIRSYVFMPYTLVKDTRTGYEDGNIASVMDGDIDGFINAYLKDNATK